MNKNEPSKDWQRIDPYSLVHPGGWRLTNQWVSGRPRWVLTCGGAAFGNFSTPEDAMAHHARIWKSNDDDAS